MTVALALRILENVVGLEAIDDEEAIEVGAKNFFGDSVAACAFAGANGVDRDLLVGKDPQPGVESANAPTGFIGVHNLGAAQGVDQEAVGGLGEFGEALFGA